MSAVDDIRTVASSEEWAALQESAEAFVSLASVVHASPSRFELIDLGERWSAASDVFDPPTERDDDATTVLGSASALATGAASSVELVERALARSDACADLGVYIALDRDGALAAAAASDQRRASNATRGPLDGVPISVKDLLTTANIATSAQSRVPDPVGGQRVDAVAVARLRAAGAVITGKTTLLEYACGAYDPAGGFPEPRNPWDESRWPGGSSSGAASGVAAGMVAGAVGTDTGGSIRVPAAYCGVTGFKPTIGRVPIEGCIPFAPTMDHVGPLARTAADCAVLAEAMEAGGRTAVADIDVSEVRIAYVADAVDELAGDVDREPFDDALGVLGSVVASVHAARTPLAVPAFAAGAVVIAAESFAWHRDRLARSWSDYGAATRLRLAAGAFVSAETYADAVRLLVAARTAALATSNDVDVIALPTSDVVAPRRDALGDPAALGATPSLTIPWSALGLPAVSVPIGLSRSGLPLGLQLVGRAHQDGVVLAVASALQERTSWHEHRP